MLPRSSLEVKLAGAEGDVPEADVTAMAFSSCKIPGSGGGVAAVERGLAILENIEYTTSEAISQTIAALGEQSG